MKALDTSDPTLRSTKAVASGDRLVRATRREQAAAEYYSYYEHGLVWGYDAQCITGAFASVVSE